MKRLRDAIMFNVNPKQLEQIMKKMGMQSEQIDAEQVVIKGKDKEIIINNPQVTKIKMGGQETFQIIGEAREQQPIDIAKQHPAVSEKFSQEDVELVVEQTGCSEAESLNALKQTGDIAQAIMKLKKA